MTLFAWLDGLRLMTDAPALLPLPSYLPWVLRGAWALVMAAGVLFLCRGSRVRSVRRAALPAALVMALWTGTPGPWGAAYWLGLAFQTPSLMAQVLALHYFWPRLRGGTAQTLDWEGALQARQRRTDRFVIAGLLLGWCLLLDTFAYLPVSVYAWGFHPWATGLVLLSAMFPWVSSGRLSSWVGVPAHLLLVVAVFWLTRWPTGNVWDALLDPWLFVGLHFYAITRYRARAGD